MSVAMNVELARQHMIEQQIRPWNVSDPHILELLGAVKREDFLPAELKALAFADLELPLPGGRRLLPPKLEAKLVQEAQVQRHEKVLQIGVGSGYISALLAHRAQSVLAQDADAALVQLARANLERAGIVNVQVQLGSAPSTDCFDVIVLAGSVAEVPQTLLAQLKPGGRLVGIVGEEPVMNCMVVTREANGGYHSVARWETVAERLPGFAQPSRFVF